MPTQVSLSVLSEEIVTMVCCCEFIRTFSFLGCASKDLITSADAGTNLVILSFRVAGSVKLRLNLSGLEAIYISVSRGLTKDANKEPPNQTAYLVGRILVSSSHIEVEENAPLTFMRDDVDFNSG